MPNWCENRWRIYCDDEEQAKAIHDLLTHEGEVTFNKIKPMPEILGRVKSPYREEEGYMIREDMEDLFSPARPATPDEVKEIEASGSTDWYDWRVENWGTKWDASDSRVELCGSDLNLDFDTAWAPPVPIVEALRERFPDLSLSAFFDEPGMEAAEQTDRTDRPPFTRIARLKVSGCRIDVGTLSEPEGTCVFLQTEENSEPVFVSVPETRLLIAALKAAVADTKQEN